MSTEAEDPAQHAVSRLEAALERIATLAASPRAPQAAPPAELPPSDVPVEEVAHRLDNLIAELRSVLGAASA